MSYDILFAGELLPGAEPAQVRARLQGLFRLSDQAAARLFTGQPWALKRGLDRAQAERLREVFLAAGAVARLVEQPAPISPSSAALGPERDDPEGRPHPSPTITTFDPANKVNWSLAADDQPLEPVPDHPPPAVDISRLHLVTDQDWSLADCDRPPASAAVPDISHLRILEREPE